MKRSNWGKIFNKNYLTIYKNILTPKRTKREVAIIEKVLKLKKKDAIFDLCCGHGRHTNALAKKGYNITGLDSCKYFLQVAGKEKTKAKFIYGDARKVNKIFQPNSFDKAYNYFTSFGYFTDKQNEQIIKGVSATLKPNGLFLLETINPFIVYKKGILKVMATYPDGKVVDINKYNHKKKRIFHNRTADFKNIKTQYDFVTRVYTPYEFKTIGKKYGLRVKKIIDENLTPLTKKSFRMIVLFQKK